MKGFLIVQHHLFSPSFAHLSICASIVPSALCCILANGLFFTHQTNKQTNSSYKLILQWSAQLVSVYIPIDFGFAIIYCHWWWAQLNARERESAFFFSVALGIIFRRRRRVVFIIITIVVTDIARVWITSCSLEFCCVSLLYYTLVMQSIASIKYTQS